MSEVEEFITAHNCGNCGHYERCGNPKGDKSVCTTWKPFQCAHTGGAAMKQIRFKNGIKIIETCEECPCCCLIGCGICKMLKAGGIPFNDIRSDCPLEDAE